jgi:hypothetical protein
MENLDTAAAVLKALGGIEQVAQLTGRTYNAVSNWRVLGSFPANTYLILQSALNAQGQTAPATLWRMERAEAAQ